jgi:5-methylcytosine-specific restriction endonuclease McrA
MSKGANPRRANGYRRDQVRARVLREETDCWLCGQPVDKTLKTPDPGSPEVDEIVPVSLGGDPLARANCRLAHRPACATYAEATARRHVSPRSSH